jgi:DNA-binding CsgD family transcriptional regulator
MTTKNNGKKMKTLNGIHSASAIENALLTEHETGILTPREIEILQFAAYGLTTTEIARQIFLSTDTVESHRKNIIRKMGAGNIAHAVAQAIRKNWIQ